MRSSHHFANLIIIAIFLVEHRKDECQAHEESMPLVSFAISQRAIFTRKATQKQEIQFHRICVFT
jgi:hypothetical protein